MADKQEDDGLLYKPEIDVREIWKPQRPSLNDLWINPLCFRAVIFFMISLLLLTVVFGGIGYAGFEIMSADVTLETDIVCNGGMDDNTGLCECISNHQGSTYSCDGDQRSHSHACTTVYTYYYEWKVIDDCDGNLKCSSVGDLYETHEASEYGDTATYDIGKVYPCSFNSDCSDFYISDGRMYKIFWVNVNVILLIFLYF